MSPDSAHVATAIGTPSFPLQLVLADIGEPDHVARLKIGRYIHFFFFLHGLVRIGSRSGKAMCLRLDRFRLEFYFNSF